MTQSAGEIRAVHFIVPLTSVDGVNEFMEEEVYKQLVVEHFVAGRDGKSVRIFCPEYPHGKAAVEYTFVVRGGLEEGKKFARAFYGKLIQFGPVFGGVVIQYSNGLD